MATVVSSVVAAAVALLAQAVAVIVFVVRVDARVSALERSREEALVAEQRWRERIEAKLDDLARHVDRLIGAQGATRR
jgi:hypothetical protein